MRLLGIYASFVHLYSILFDMVVSVVPGVVQLVRRMPGEQQQGGARWWILFPF